MTYKNNNRKLDGRLRYIESILAPYDLMPEKTSLSEEQVVKLYSKLVASDMLFRECEQILLFKKERDDLIKSKKKL